MARTKEQFDRFYAVLSAKREFSIDCEKCPIKEQCFEYAETHCPETDENALCCEELLLSFILTGETPKPQGSFAFTQKPADNGPHSRFFSKVNPFQHLFTNCLHFQFFPYFPENLRPDREFWTSICSHSAYKCSSARGRPRKAVFPTGPRICEFFATSSGRLYAPYFSRNPTGAPYESNQHFKPRFFKHLSKSETLFMRGI